MRSLEETAARPNARQAVYALSLLEEVPDYPMEELALRLMGQAPPEVRAKLFEIAQRRGLSSLAADARAELARGWTPALKPAVRYAFANQVCDGQQLEAMLHSPDPRIIEAAVEASPDIPLAWARFAIESDDPQRRRLGVLALRLASLGVRRGAAQNALR